MSTWRVIYTYPTLRNKNVMTLISTQLSQLDSHGNPCIFVGNLQHLVDLLQFAEYIQQCDGRLDINNQTWAEFVWLPLKLKM